MMSNNKDHLDGQLTMAAVAKLEQICICEQQLLKLQLRSYCPRNQIKLQAPVQFECGEGNLMNIHSPLVAPTGAFSIFTQPVP